MLQLSALKQQFSCILGLDFEGKKNCFMQNVALGPRGEGGACPTLPPGTGLLSTSVYREGISNADPRVMLCFFFGGGGFASSRGGNNKEGSNSAVVACAHLKPAARVGGPLRERLVEIFFLFLPFNLHWRRCVSRGSHNHLNGGDVSLTLTGT